MQGTQGQIHRLDSRRNDSPSYGGEYDANYDGDVGNDDPLFEQDAHPAPSEYDSTDRDETRAFGPLVGALSGAIVGFFFAGAFDLAVATFVALAVGGILGWYARGIAE